MLVTNNLDLLINSLQNSNYIGIDGSNGSGKSTLAIGLAAILNLEHRISGLSRYIIEGVCLLAVTKHLGLSLDKLIYVKLMDTYDSWNDEDNCSVTSDINEFIENQLELLQLMCGNKSIKSIGLAEEIIRYHHQYKPQDIADIIYKRIEE